MAVEDSLGGADQGIWLTRWDQEHANLLEALEHAASRSDLQGSGLTICVGVWRFWFKRAFLTEGHEQLTRALRHNDGRDTDPVVLADAFNASGTFAYSLAEYDVAIERYTRSLEIFESAGAEAGQVIASTNLANPLLRKGEVDRAHAILTKALSASRRVAEDRYTASIVANLGSLEVMSGRLEKAHEFFEEALDLFRRMGEPHGTRLALTNLAYVLENSGKIPEARAYYTESIEMMRQLGDRRGIVSTLAKVVMMEASSGEVGRVHSQLEECLSLASDIEDRQAQINSIEASAAFAAAVSRQRSVAQLVAASGRRREEWGLAYEPAEKVRMESLLDSARSQLGEAEFDLASRLGRNMELSAVLTSAKALLEGPRA